MQVMHMDPKATKEAFTKKKIVSTSKMGLSNTTTDEEDFFFNDGKQNINIGIKISNLSFNDMTLEAKAPRTTLFTPNIECESCVNYKANKNRNPKRKSFYDSKS